MEYFTEKIETWEARIEWKEVLCGVKVTKVLIRQLQDKLIAEGHKDLIENGEMDKRTKGMLMEFQKMNGLPIGQLDVETMERLEIR